MEDVRGKYGRTSFISGTTPNTSQFMLMIMTTTIKYFVFLHQYILKYVPKDRCCCCCCCFCCCRRRRRCVVIVVIDVENGIAQSV
jgi:hypothetical protein